MDQTTTVARPSRLRVAESYLDTVAQLREEREAHAETRAKLDAANEVIEELATVAATYRELTTTTLAEYAAEKKRSVRKDETIAAQREELRRFTRAQVLPPTGPQGRAA